MTQKQDLQRKMVSSLGGGIAVADMSRIQPAQGHPTPPAEGLPAEQYAADIEAFCKTSKCKFLSQDESDPSYLVFEDEANQRFKMKQDIFISGFRGSVKGEEEKDPTTSKK